MTAASVTFKPVGNDGMSCEVRSPLGLALHLSGTLTAVEPDARGDEPMLANPALIHNAWAYAKNEKLFRRMKNADKKASHRKRADEHETTVSNIARLIDGIGDDSRTGWCSACFTRSDHRKVDLGRSSVPAYLCATCGSPTLKCAAPRCRNMAVRGIGALRVPRFCAEHRHELPSFERADDTIARIEDYRDLQIFDKSNLSRGSKFAMAGVLAAGVVGTGGFLAAPAVGGAVGTLAGGYAGAAATSYGLAMLGGGSIAAGGLGMVGGTYVVAAAGAALGSALGASVTNAYVSEDKSFAIELFRDGADTPVIVARGFTTESDQNWASAMRLVEKRYPDSPIYRLRWGSKELRDAGGVIGGAGSFVGMSKVTGIAMRAGKAAAGKLTPVAPGFMAASLAKNPWHTAVVRADRTGVALAGILARSEQRRFVLIGHSLGARVMITAAETLGTSDSTPVVESMHLLGAAATRKHDWRPLSEAVEGSVYNYHSQNDAVLKYAYTIAQAGKSAVGLRGFGSSYPSIKDRDVSSSVSGHSEYFRKVTLA